MAKNPNNKSKASGGSGHLPAEKRARARAERAKRRYEAENADRAPSKMRESAMKEAEDAAKRAASSAPAGGSPTYASKLPGGSK